MGLLMARYRRVLVINSQGYSQCYSRRKNLRHLRNLRDFIQRPDRSQKICVHLCNLWDLFSEHIHLKKQIQTNFTQSISR